MSSERHPESSTEKLVCDLNALPPEERASHEELGRHLFERRVREVAEVDAGFAFRFEADDITDLAHWVSRERLCCPFLRLMLESVPRGGPVWLTLSGGDAVQAFLRDRIAGSSA